MRWALIPARVVMQVFLMIILGIPPFPCFHNNRRDFAIIPLLAHFLSDLFSLLLLLRRVVKDAAAVLSARVHTLPVQGCGVVHAVEEGEKGSIADL